MKVTLFDYTGAGSKNPSRYAANLLVYTKSTRLQMSPSLMDAIEKRSDEEILQELEAMSNTLPSSWEFVNFTFLIENVTRAFTHQIVRTRNASYAQQAMRIVNISEKFEYSTGWTIKSRPVCDTIYSETMDYIHKSYEELIKNGSSVEDARGILPTNILTNINMKIDMRNLINLIWKRSSLRVQDEYRKVLDQMLIEVEKVYSWFYIFVKKDELQAFKDLSELINDNKNLTSEEKLAMFKKLDLMHKEI